MSRKQKESTDSYDRREDNASSDERVGSMTRDIDPGYAPAGEPRSYIRTSVNFNSSKSQFRMNTAVSYFVLAPFPADDEETLRNQASIWYSGLRSKNTGASNFNIARYLCLGMNVDTLVTLTSFTAARLSAAQCDFDKRSDSPAIPYRMYSGQTWTSIWDVFALKRDKLKKAVDLMKSIIVPDLGIYRDRVKMFFRLFSDMSDKDTGNEQEAFSILVPAMVWKYSIDGNNVVATRYITKDLGAYTIDELIQLILDLISEIRQDDSTALLIGDLIREYEANRTKNLVRLDLTGLFIDPEGNMLKKLPIDSSPESHMLTENASILWGEGGVSSRANSATFDPETGIITMKAAGIIDYVAPSRARLSKWNINRHFKEYSREWEQIATRFMPKAEYSNQETSSVWTITVQTGYVIIDAAFITAASPDGTTTAERLSSLVHTAVTSSVQSTALAARNKIDKLVSLVDFSPQIIFDLESQYGDMWDIGILTDESAEQLYSSLTDSVLGLTKKRVFDEEGVKR